MGDIDRSSPMDHYYVHDNDGELVARPKTPASPGITGALSDAASAIKGALGIGTPKPDGPAIITPSGAETPQSAADKQAK